MTRSCLLALLFAVPLHAEDKPSSPAREALKPFNDLVGSWNGTGEPEGTRAEKIKGFWTETIDWEWQFKGDDASMKLTFDKGKYFAAGELRYVPDKKVFRLSATTPEKKTLIFEGPLEGKRLTLERQDPATKETQRLVFTFLHANRHLYRYEVKKDDSVSFAKQYQVGATKKGVPFATGGDSYPECIVSGGRGTIAVMYKGKTYYVCCSGCRDEFKDNPEKYIKEFEAKQKK
jgi:YHS domain-containing protein